MFLFLFSTVTNTKLLKITRKYQEKYYIEIQIEPAFIHRRLVAQHFWECHFFFVLDTVLRFLKKALMSFDKEALVLSLFFRFFDSFSFGLLVSIVSMPALLSTQVLRYLSPLVDKKVYQHIFHKFR